MSDLAQEWRAAHSRETAAAIGIVADPTAIKGLEMGKHEAKKVSDFINSPGEWTAFKEGLNTWIANRQKAQDDILRQADIPLRPLAPDKQARKGIAMWLEAGRDMEQITKWGATVKSAEGREAYKMAGALKPDELAVAKKIQERFASLLTEANLNGIDVAERERYVTHLIHNPSADIRTGSTRGISDYFKFKKHREYDSFYDAFQDGAQPKTLDAAEILSVYEATLREAINIIRSSSTT